MAVVVPDVDVLKHWAIENHIRGTLSVLCNNAQVKELIMSDMLNCGKQSGLKSFEQVCNRISIYCNMWTNIKIITIISFSISPCE